MTTIHEAALELARITASVVEGAATANGAWATLTDTNRYEGDDYFNRGVIWMLSGDNEGICRTITDWVNSTKTFTFLDFTYGVLEGDVYAACPGDFTKDVFFQYINVALRKLGRRVTADISLETAAGQESYALPEGVVDVRRVEIATATAEPYGFQKSYHWRLAEGYLYFDSGWAPGMSGYVIRLWYVPAAVATLTEDEPDLPAHVDMDHLIWTAAVHLLRWRLKMTKGDDKQVVGSLNEALVNAERELGRFARIYDLARDPHHG